MSLRTEPGVLTMYAVAEKDNPCNITILETYAGEAAYKSHIASPHFQKYKQGTLHMVKSLVLSDQKRPESLQRDKKLYKTLIYTLMRPWSGAGPRAH